MDDTEDWLELYLKNSRDPFDYDLWADHYRHHLHPQILLRSTIIIQNTTPRHCNAIVIWFPERAALGPDAWPAASRTVLGHNNGEIFLANKTNSIPLRCRSPVLINFLPKSRAPRRHSLESCQQLGKFIKQISPLFDAFIAIDSGPFSM